MERSASAGPTAARAAMNRMQGPALLAVLALVGLGLAVVGQIQPTPAEVAGLAVEHGSTILLAIDPTDDPSFLSRPEIRLVISRLPITLDAVRSVISIEGGSELVLPPGWTTALVDRTGRLTRFEGEIDPRRAQALVQALVKDKSLEGARRILGEWNPRLASFLVD